LITGGLGYLGQALANELLAKKKVMDSNGWAIFGKSKNAESIGLKPNTDLEAIIREYYHSIKGKK